MRRALGLAAVALAATPAHAAGGETSLRATAWPKGTAAAGKVERTLRCDPPRGSVARPVAACRAVEAAGRAAFRPTPPGAACTQIYGGPAVALVTGTLDGRRVWARFDRENGCEINRWQRLVLVLGPAGVVP
jgi:Subtilisin inhibitor-like